MPVPRKLLATAAAIATALAALALPAASAQGGYTAKRIPRAHIAAGHHGIAKIARASRAKATAAADCANADLTPTAANLALIRQAILCLHNEVRAERGLPALTGNAKLRRAAEGHSADMVAKSYFNHTSKSGASMVDRIMRAGYVGPDDGWILGENLEWGTGGLATPQGAIDAWMDSPGHRANIVKRGYKHMGIGITLGTPTGAANGVTITVDFGARR